MVVHGGEKGGVVWCGVVHTVDGSAAKTGVIRAPRLIRRTRGERVSIILGKW